MMIRLNKYFLSTVLLLLLSACTPSFFLLGQAAPLNFEPSLSKDKVIFSLAEQQGIKTDKRPMAAGFYDAQVNKTFVAWLGQQSNSFVQAYDHLYATWEAPKQVTFIQRSRFYTEPDRHNYPMLIQAKDGKLLLFYAEHSDELRLAVSPEAHSLDGLWRDSVIKKAPFAAYPMPVKTRKGDIYVFYRESSFNLDSDLDLDDRPMQYIVSENNGESWRSFKDISGEDIALGSWDRDNNLDEIYMAQIRYQPRMGLTSERIHMVWTLAGGGNEGPKHDRYHKDVYYAYFRPANKHFYCAGGKDKGVSLDKREMQDCIVEDTGSLNRNEPQAVSYIQLVHYADGGKPLVIYQINREGGSVIRSASWTGKDWQFTDISQDGFILDMEKTGSQSFRFYAGRGRIQEYETTNAGVDWQLVSEFELPDDKRVVKLTVLDDYKEPARLLITDITDTATPSATVFLAGEARCLKEGSFYLKSASGDYLSIVGFDTSTTRKQLILRELDKKDKGQVWHIQNQAGKCVIKNEEIDAYLSFDTQLHLSDNSNEQSQWLIQGTLERTYNLKHLQSKQFLQAALADEGIEITLDTLKDDSETPEDENSTAQEDSLKSPDWQLEPFN